MTTPMTSVELTVTELDGLLAEQLPARELMTRSNCGCDGHHGDNDQTWQSNENNSLITVVNVQQNADDGGENSVIEL